MSSDSRNVVVRVACIAPPKCLGASPTLVRPVIPAGTADLAEAAHEWGCASRGNIHCGATPCMPEGTPLANLWLTQARMMGLDMKRFADSSGTIDQLLAER